MNLYSQEISIKDRIIGETTSSMVLPLVISEDIKEDVLAKINDEKLKTLVNTNADESHPGLLYCSAILVSTVMNKNDDVFLPEDTWNARNTIIGTAFDEEHEKQFVIGHIYGSRVLLKDGTIYNEETPPSYFDIECDIVVYKDRFPDIADGIISGYKDRTQFISMEASFKNFDYALISSDQKISIVQRNENTAFLTKYLRIYGGEGYYGQYRLGRVLRNYTFVGAGNVKKPANPRSEYTNIEAACIISSDTTNSDNFFKFLFKTKGNIMVIQNMDEAKVEIVKLEAKAAEYEDKLKNMVEASVAESAKAELQKKINELSASVKELTEKLSVESSKLEIATKQINDNKTSLEASVKEIEEKVKANEYLNKALEEYKKASKDAGRMTSAGEAGIKGDEAYMKKFLEMSDESFNAVIEYAKANLTNVEADKKKDEKKDKEEDKKDAEKKAKADLEQVKVDDKEAQKENLAGGEPESKYDSLVAVASEIINQIRPIITKDDKKKGKK